MTSVTDVCNRMLQRFGTRITVTDAQVAGSNTNETKQFNLIYTELRDRLLRMAPWDCGLKVANLTYITSTTGTPENTSAATNLWQPGQPSPPFAYEYQYPVDCLRACWIIPASQTGFAGGVPITTAVTGGASSWWGGQPISFKVQTDQFYACTAAAVNAGGAGYAVGDLITLVNLLTVNGLTNKIATFSASAPQGAPVVLRVATIGGGGSVATVAIVNAVNGEATPFGGSYFYDYAAISNLAVAQGSTTGAGLGATFNLTFANDPAPQRVVLTNQEFATLAYVQQVTDPNVWDPAFRDAIYAIGAAYLCRGLNGSMKKANELIGEANAVIKAARADDGNEGLTVNDVTPDWIRIRGIAFQDGLQSGPYTGYDWGSYFPMF